MSSAMKLKDANEIIDAHFSGRGGPHSALAAANAIAEIPEAKKYWDRKALFSSLDPQAASAKDRVATSLGVPTAAEKRGFVWGGIGAFAMAAGLFAFMSVSPNVDDDGFSPRGPKSEPISASVFAFNISKGKTALDSQSSILASDELAFAYVNPQGQKHLLIYGVDDKENIYWFHPAWTNFSEPPKAIAIDDSTQVKELQEAIGHDYIGRKLKIYGWFVDAPLSVVKAEKAISEAGERGVSAATLISSVTLQRKSPE